MELCREYLGSLVLLFLSMLVLCLCVSGRLEQHHVVHTKDRPKPYECPQCHHKYSTRRVMVAHAMREHSLTVARYGCITCGNEFGSSKGLYMQHVLQCKREWRMRNIAMKSGTRTEDDIAQQVLSQITAELTVDESEGAKTGQNDGTVVTSEDLTHIVHEVTSQEVVTQIAEEIILENPDQSVQYVIVDPDGNILETIEMNNLDMSQVKIEAGGAEGGAGCSRSGVA